MPDNGQCKTKHSLPLRFASPQELHEIMAEAYSVTTFHEEVDVDKYKADQKEQQVGNMAHKVYFIILFGTYLWLYCRGTHVI